MIPLTRPTERLKKNVFHFSANYKPFVFAEWFEHDDLLNSTLGVADPKIPPPLVNYFINYVDDDEYENTTITAEWTLANDDVMAAKRWGIGSRNILFRIANPRLPQRVFALIREPLDEHQCALELGNHFKMVINFNYITCYFCFLCLKFISKNCVCKKHKIYKLTDNFRKNIAKFVPLLKSSNQINVSLRNT